MRGWDLDQENCKKLLKVRNKNRNNRAMRSSATSVLALSETKICILLLCWIMTVSPINQASVPFEVLEEVISG